MLQAKIQSIVDAEVELKGAYFFDFFPENQPMTRCLTSKSVTGQLKAR